MKLLPKLLVFFVFLASLSLTAFFLPSKTHALLLDQENQTMIEPGGEGFDDKAFNLNQMAGTVDSVNYLLSCNSQSHPEIMQSCLQNNQSALGAMGGLIAKLYNPPISSVQYFAYLKENLGLASPAYAQGTGFPGLAPILPLWRVFRDAAYMLFIILFIVTGVMIMLRMKISPQAVVTVQSALPGILITLILITLSYAIAGLLIDFMYVFIYFIINLLSRSTVNIDSLRNFQDRNIFEYWSTAGKLGFNSITAPAAGIGEIVAKITNNTFVLTGILSGGANLIAIAVLTIAVIFALFRLFFILLKSYVWILVLVILAPLMLLIGALPGRSGFSTWIRGLLSNLAVFPTTIAMFALAAIFIKLSEGAASPGWVAPLIGGNSQQTVSALIGLGMLLLTPQVAQMMSDALKPPPFPYGVAIGQAIGAGPTAIGGAARRGLASRTYELGPNNTPRRRDWRALF